MDDNNGVNDEDTIRDNTGMFTNADQPQLSEDNDSPAAPADDVHESIESDNPALDNYDDIDSHEAYDVGLANASGVTDMHQDNDLKDDALHGNDDLTP